MSTLSERGTQPTARQSVAPAVGPLLVLAGIAVLWISDRLVIIGPFDRAQVAGSVGMPMLLLGPVAAGFAAEARRRTGPIRWAPVVAVGIAVGVTLVGAIAATTSQLGCELVANPFVVVGRMWPVGAVIGAGYVASAAVTGVVSRRSRWVGVAAGVSVGIAAVFATILALVVIAPPLSCGYLSP